MKYIISRNSVFVLKGMYEHELTFVSQGKFSMRASAQKFDGEVLEAGIIKGDPVPVSTYTCTYVPTGYNICTRQGVIRPECITCDAVHTVRRCCRETKG